MRLFMKSVKMSFLFSSLVLLTVSLSSCVSEQQQGSAQLEEPRELLAPVKPAEPQKPLALPIKYQTPSYVIDQKATELDEVEEETSLKVGARITSTRGPQPLWDILKRLASLKGMNISWASDVDRNVLVDVDINPNDDFFMALDNLLRQVDYHQVLEGSTIVIKYKETKQYHIPMPFIKQTYKTNTGGDVLGASNRAQGDTKISGEITLATEGVGITNHKNGEIDGVEFNTWRSIENNLNAILNIWSTEEVKGIQKDKIEDSVAEDAEKNSTTNKSTATATFRKSTAGNSYFIDKPIGLITVTAPRNIMVRLDAYFATLKRELFKQVAIEAKILEVQLNDNSSIGLNWNQILSNLSISGSGSFGKSRNDSTTEDSRRSESFNSSFERRSNRTDNAGGETSGSTIENIASSMAGGLFNSGFSTATVITDALTSGAGSAVSLAAFSFDNFLNVVSEQGKTTILSNPKLSVLNGQPSLITVGKSVTFVEEITAEVDDESGDTKYTVETGSVLSGIGLALTANILDDNELILNLVPVTSELEEPIEYRSVGLGEVGLPVINLREMSTTVRVKNGEMLVIGGLISGNDENTDSFVPGTRNVPFFKYLFGYEKKTKIKRELIILLQPRIL